MKKKGLQYFPLIIVLIAIGGLCIGALGLTPISSNFFRYLIWRMTSTASILKGHVRAGDVEIHYVSYGSGPAVLLLHGGLSNRLSWFSQIPWLVDSGRRVVVPDTRGHGNSGLGDGELTYRLLASDVIEIIDRLSIEQVDVVGWSDGGNTALLLGLYWPQRVRRIVALSANFSPAGLTPQAHKETVGRRSGMAYWLSRLWTGAGKRFRKLEARIKHMWRLRPNLQPDDLGKIAAPTLVIVGESDIVSISHARQMAEQLAHGSLVIIPGGHFTPITQALRVNRLIAEFLDIEPMHESAESDAYP